MPLRIPGLCRGATLLILAAALVSGCVRGFWESRSGEAVLDSTPRLDIPSGSDRSPADARPPGDGLCSATLCPLGCNADGRCRTFAPSNTTTPLPPGCGPVTLAPESQIDTSGCKIQNPDCKGVLSSGPSPLCLIAVQGLTIPAGVAVRPAGSYPLVLLVEQDADLLGMIDVGAKSSLPGPGGAPGGIAKGPTSPADGAGLGGGRHCACTTKDDDDCGGGGAGFGSPGGSGGLDSTSCGSTSPGGSAYGVASLVPLVGSSGGATGNNAYSVEPAWPGNGGGGGGALQISAQRRITLSGTLTAGGGGGGGGQCVAGGTASPSAGGGGGSGGAVLLEAPEIAGAGWVAANGGGGGGGGSYQDGCSVNVGQGGAGEDGKPGEVPAAGGTKGADSAGLGGPGAAGRTDATAGQSATQAGSGAGGGGGGVGRIRLNVSGGKLSPLLRRSGSTSVGELQPN
jgi:hypothetical protein